ncbi:MAG TPA: hypothetical protein VJ914_02500 [Pseudonocardiaceae bacterium]|nr:hypothetical protein [Pseudonocardiaceae bacterium]
MTNRLGHKQTAAMFTLLVLGREVPNPELREIVGFTLDSKDRVELNKHGYVTSRKRGRALAHTITERGVAWCQSEIGEKTPPPPKARSLLVPAMYLVLRAFDEYLRGEKLNLTDVLGQRSELTRAQIEQRIKTAYRKLAGSNREWVGLVDLRSMLGEATTEDVDTVLKELSRTGQVSLVPESNRKTLTTADHEAAIRIGGEDNHLISIEAS